MGNQVEYNFTGKHYILMFLIGLLTCISNQLLIYAFTLDKVGRIHGLFFLLVAMGYLEDLVLYNKSVSILEILGTILIIGCSTVVFLLRYFKISN
jgi:uncharacterized membrane protein